MEFVESDKNRLHLFFGCYSLDSTRPFAKETIRGFRF